MDYAVIVLLWAGYCFLHSLLISVGVTTLMARLMKKWYAVYRILYVAISFVLLVPLLRFTSGLEGPDIITYASTVNILRYVLITASLALFFWSFFFDYDALSFFGIRQILNSKRSPQTVASAGLKKKGLLGFTRHPMYLTLLVYLWCQIYSMVDLVVTIVLTIYIFIGTRLEERKLVLEFGESYIAYQREVPMLIPFRMRRT
ncbi:MAG TPA: protein-S-isoprenylcysteine methyltransferase [Bacteroidota bacterium]|nr:protein-S-isoprenylcysteine methyltransferase [Bacteroidota bacterium]